MTLKDWETDAYEDQKEQANIQKLGLIVLEQAKKIFVECDAEGDFCVHEIKHGNAVFGRWNKIAWGTLRGFEVITVNSTKDFIEKFKEWEKKK